MDYNTMEFLNSGQSPVPQNYIWLSEYIDGTYLAEFEGDGKENSFYSIKRENIARFGLVGNGQKLFFERSGVFNLGGVSIEASYWVGDKEYPLTGHYNIYNDIITYKDAEAILNINGSTGGATEGSIKYFNFGYKTKIDIDGISFNFKVICKVAPTGERLIEFSLQANQDLNGRLVIKKNNEISTNIDAPLTKGVVGAMLYNKA